jgi:hypothetical protein
MAFTGDEIQYKRWDMFHFYDASIAVNSLVGLSTSLVFSVLWKLAEVRMHFSTALISDMTLRVRLSSIKNSSLNTILVSQAMVGVQDLAIHYSDPLLFFSEDCLIATTSTISVANLIGIEAIGWAVRG